MSGSLAADAAARLTRRLVGRFNWDHESQMAEAYRELLPEVRQALDAFAEKLLRRAKRLRPLEQPTYGDKTDATE